MRLILICTLCIVATMFACSTTRDTVKYTVASKTVDCQGVVPQKCMLIKKGNDDQWTYFYSKIEGFTYQEGYEYVLEVKEEKKTNTPADASSIRYILVKEVSKQAKQSDKLPR